MFFEKYYFIEDMNIYCNDSDEKYYDEECINLFLGTLKNIFFLVWDFKVPS